MQATAKKSTEIIETLHGPETDAIRRARLKLEHRKALHALASVTLRYQVHNELSVARRESEAEFRESESRIRARGR